MNKAKEQIITISKRDLKRYFSWLDGYSAGGGKLKECQVALARHHDYGAPCDLGAPKARLLVSQWVRAKTVPVHDFEDPLEKQVEAATRRLQKCQGWRPEG